MLQKSVQQLVKQWLLVMAPSSPSVSGQICSQPHFHLFHLCSTLKYLKVLKIQNISISCLRTKIFQHLQNYNLYRVSQKKHSYKIFGLEIMLFTCSQTLWSGLRSSFTKWGTAPAFTTACKTTMSASRWRAWSLVQKFYKSVFSGTPCISQLLLFCTWHTHHKYCGSVSGTHTYRYTSGDTIPDYCYRYYMSLSGTHIDT